MGCEYKGDFCMYELSFIELLILHTLSKGYMEVTVHRGFEYYTDTLPFVLMNFTSFYNQCQFRTNNPAGIQEFLKQYTQAYQSGSLAKRTGAENTYRYDKSMRETLSFLKKEQEQFGNKLKIDSQNIPDKVNLGADLLCLEEKGILKISPMEEAGSISNFFVGVELLQDVTSLLNQLGLQPSPKPVIKHEKGALKILNPFQVLYGKDSVSIKERSLEGRLLEALMAAPKHQVAQQVLLKRLYPKLSSKEGYVRERLKSLCKTINTKLRGVKCPYRIHQETTSSYTLFVFK